MAKQRLTQRQSYQNKVQNFNRRKRYVIFFVLLFLSYHIVSNVFLRSYTVRNNGMLPLYSSSSRIIASPFGYGPTIFAGHRFPTTATPQRGEVVLSILPGHPRSNFLNELFRPVIRFSSLNFSEMVIPERQLGLPELVIKRVIALPGDTLYMQDYVVFVRPRGQNYFINEFELSYTSYETLRGANVANWEQFLPLSSSFQAITLADDEYFLLGDNRTLVNDSRTFGPVARRDIRARVVGSYFNLRFN
ncbi:MAG: signal peptidase I [Spirochaetaceae bacterium]|nr:signal peptidase I [Spirochaetaceae bacterium]